MTTAEGERIAPLATLADLLGGRGAADAGGWDPVALVDAADAHGVSTLVWQALARAGGTAARVREQLDARARGAVTRDLLVQAEMRRVLAAIAGAGGRAVVFKGSALAYTLYEQPWLRPRTDTDLMTAKADVPAVSDAILSCGYLQSDALSSGTLVSHQIAFERVDAHGLHHVIDLHWKVVNPQLLADVLRFDEIWDGAIDAPALGPTARVPSLVASVILGCVHRLAHHQGQDRLIWLYDLKLLTERFAAADWESLSQTAAERRVSAICLDGLRQAHQRLGAPLPGNVAARLEAAGLEDPSRRYIEAAVHKRDVLASDLRTLPGWSARFRLLREHAFPSSAFVLRRYGRENRLWLPALYAHRLVTGAYRWFRP